MTKSGTVVPTVRELKIGGLKFRFQPFIFANWTILNDLEQKKCFKKFRRIIQYGHFWPLWVHDENCTTVNIPAGSPPPPPGGGGINKLLLKNRETGQK